MKRSNKTKILFVLFIVISVLLYIVLNYKGEEIKYLSYLDKKVYYKDLKHNYLDIKDDLKIKRISYSWRKTLKGKNNPKVIVFHHADSKSLSPEEINEIHKEKGWDGIGYHYYIREDGTIYSGRPEECIGSHVYGDNKDSLGICLEGNFEEEEPTEEEIESLVNLSVYLILKYNIPTCKKHSDLYNTLCPGRLFPMDEIEKRIKEKIENMIV